MGAWSELSSFIEKLTEIKYSSFYQPGIEPVLFKKKKKKSNQLGEQKPLTLNPSVYV